MPDASRPLPGVVHLVGAGPGDPGLLTVRGRALLERCDAVVYDALANPALLADIRAERFDVGKRGGSTESARQDAINDLLVRLARDGKQVVRLKGGDPFVFGRGSEEAEALAAAGIRFEVVPGVTAGIAAPAYAGIPITHRGLSTSVTFVTGHEDPEKGAPGVDWSALARAGGTLVLYMGLKTLPHIVGELLRSGVSPDTPAAAVRWGTYPRQETVTATLHTLVDRVREAGLGAPVITIIGAVVSLRATIAWFEQRPLFGRRVLVTRARPAVVLTDGRGDRATLSDDLAAAGAEVMELPATRIETVDPAPLGQVLHGLARYQWVIFTSQNAVEIFWTALRESGRDARALASCRIAAVGPATGDALEAHGLAPDLVPERFVAEGLLERFREEPGVRGACVLYLAAEGARDVLPKGLRELGAEVQLVLCYRSVPDREAGERLRDCVERGEIDLATFTSAAAVHAFVDAVGTGTARRVPAASIGPVTSDALRAAGMEPVIEATRSTMPDLVEAIIEWANARASAEA